MQTHPQICFITGAPQCGKTTFLLDIIAAAQNMGLAVGGFAALGLWQNNRRAGFVLKNLATGQTEPLSGRSPQSREMGGYVFYPQGFAAGLKTLEPENLKDKNLVVVDEVGWLETRGNGWAPALPRLAATNVNQIWVVRNGIVNEVCRKWQLKPALVVAANDSEAKNLVLEWLGNSNL